ncbi:MAG: PIN domain-containing protein, partial [Acidobacteriota bacterium]
ICVMELRYGTQRHPDGKRLWQQISESIFPRIQVLPLRFKEARQAADILAELAAQGEPIGLEDVLIGATAMTNGLTVATRNLRHFNRIRGLQAESWWDD